jgi:hypothetical protein
LAITEEEFRQRQVEHLNKTTKQAVDAEIRLALKLRRGRLVVIELLDEGKLTMKLAKKLNKWLEATE